MDLRQGCVWLSMLLFAVTAAAQTTVTTSGGTTNSIPIFTGDASIGSSGAGVSSGMVTAGGFAINTSDNGTDSGHTYPNYGLTWQDFSGGTMGPSAMLSGWGGINLYTEGVRRLTVIGNGYVGIGTESPTEKLQIVGSASAPAIGSTDAGLARFSESSGGNGIDIGYYYDPGTAYGWIQSEFTGGTAAYYALNLNPLGGDVGIGTTSPSAKLEVDGGIKLTSGSGGSITFPDGTVQSTAYTGVACGGDFAESVDVTGNPKTFTPGDVLVADPDHPGDFLKSSTPYSTAVLGVYSTKPGFVGRRMKGPKGPNEVPMAMVGIVPTKVTAMNGPIHVGDLLVTSSIPGYAMKGTNRSRMLGAIIGKALGNLQSGKGVIEVGVTLQ